VHPERPSWVAPGRTRTHELPSASAAASSASSSVRLRTSRTHSRGHDTRHHRTRLLLRLQTEIAHTRGRWGGAAAAGGEVSSRRRRGGWRQEEGRSA